MIKHLLKLASVVILWAVASIASAHTYFFGMTDLTLNGSSKTIEIIHQFTTHDVENAIAEQQQINFSPEHKDYEALIQSYVEKHFSLQHLNKQVKINWLGLEVKSGNIYIYQEAPFESFLTGLLVKNDLLVNTYPKQVNILNFQGINIKGSITFNAIETTAVFE